jgi:hypothetical protein
MIPTPNGGRSIGALSRAIRDVLWRGLVELVNDPAALSELLTEQTRLNDPSLAERAEKTARALRDCILSKERRLRITPSYPASDAHMPALTVNVMTGGEQPDEATAADHLYSRTQQLRPAVAVMPDGTEVEFIGPAPEGYVSVRLAPVVEHRVRAATMSESVEISAWSSSAELSEALHAAAHRVLFERKGWLIDTLGLLSLDMAHGSVAPSPQMTPTQAPVPVLKVSARYMVTYTDRIGPKPGGFQVLPGTFF